MTLENINKIFEKDALPKRMASLCGSVITTKKEASNRETISPLL